MLTNYYTLLHLVKELQILQGCKLVECITQEKSSAVFTFYDSISFHNINFYGMPNFEALFYSNNFNRKKSNFKQIFQSLYGEILQNIELVDKNRLIKLEFINFNLYFSLFGKSNNFIVLTDSENNILDSFLYSDKIGEKFEFPNPTYFDLKNLSEDISISKALSYSELLLGKYYSIEVLKQLKIDSKSLIKEINSFDVEKVIQNAANLSKILIDSDEYFILQNTNNDFILSLIRLSEFPEIVFKSNSISETIRRVLISRIKERKFKDKFNEFKKFAELDFRRAQKNLKSIENSILKQNLIQKYNYYCEILYTYPNLKEKGKSFLQMNDFDGNLVEIELNPKYSIIDNINLFYSKVKKLKKGIEFDEIRKDSIILEFNTAEIRLKDLVSRNELKGLKEHFIKFKKFYLSKMAKEEKEISERFRKFVLSDEAILYVGKDSKNNDELTFGFGKPNDYWFHLRGGSGSHCLLKFSGKGNPTKEILEKSASIAAYYSSQRNGGFVPVAFTQKKYIRKPKGAHPGSVIMAKEEVILVEPKVDF